MPGGLLQPGILRLTCLLAPRGTGRRLLLPEPHRVRCLRLTGAPDSRGFCSSSPSPRALRKQERRGRAVTEVDPPHPASLPVDKLLQDCEVKHTRRGGPGGQHRNKVNTAVVITHLGTRLRAEGSARRSQLINHKTAVRRLRLELATKVRTRAHNAESTSWQPGEVRRRRFREWPVQKCRPGTAGPLNNHLLFFVRTDHAPGNGHRRR